MEKLKNEDIAENCIGLVQKRLAAIANIDPAEVTIRNDVVLAWASRSFFMGKSQRMHFITHQSDLVQFGKQDAADRLTTCFGSPIDLTEGGPNVALFKGTKDSDEVAKRRSQLLKTTRATIIEQIEIHRQRERLGLSVDMFSTEARVDTADPMIAEVVLPYTPFKVIGTRNELIERDYYEKHFPQALAVLKFIVASRFASNRKKCYLWLQAVSNFGKDLFLGTLEQVGAASSMSMREVTACLNGQTGGRTPDTLLHAFVCWFDEFRTVNPEIKQLQDSVTISAKFMPLTRVPVFAKVFTSADEVKALAGDEGVEDQMANRFCHIRGESSIESRELWSVPAYPNAVKHWITTTLNELVESYRAEGREAASVRADEYLQEFYGEFGIEHNHERFSTNYTEKAYDFVLKLHELRDRMTKMESEKVGGITFHNAPGQMINTTQAILKLANAAVDDIMEDTTGSNQGFYLRRPNKVWNLYVDAFVEHSAKTSMNNSSGEVIKSMDPRGAKNRRIDGVQFKSIKLPAIADLEVALDMKEGNEPVQMSAYNGKGPWVNAEEDRS